MLSYPLTFDYSDPKLDADDKSNLELMINDHVGDTKVRNESMNTFNAQYTTLLKDHLNNEEVIGTGNINYTYAGISFNYLNVVKEYTLLEPKDKGLTAKFFLELDGHTTDCTPDKIVFNKDYGGLQEVYSISAIANTFKYAVEKGLYDVDLLDKTY